MGFTDAEASKLLTPEEVGRHYMHIWPPWHAHACAPVRVRDWGSGLGLEPPDPNREPNPDPERNPTLTGKRI